MRPQLQNLATGTGESRWILTHQLGMGQNWGTNEFKKKMFAPTQKLLHTYNRHHHIMIIMIIITLKFATPSEQYVDWGNNINFIFIFKRVQKFITPSEQYVDWGNNINYISMRDRNSPPCMNNMLVGVITSTLSS